MNADARHIDVAKVVPMLRAELKRVFDLPARFFSIRSNRYVGGNTIYVTWTDGPTEKQVKEATHGFADARFEGMADRAYGADSWFCPHHGVLVIREASNDDDVRASRCCARAELVHFGVSYVHIQRELSLEFTDELRDRVVKESGMPGGDLETRLPPNSPYQWSGFSRVIDGVYCLAAEIAR
jgi:hypothetical protein